MWQIGGRAQDDKPESPIWTSDARIVQFSCPGHNEFAKAGVCGDHDVPVAKSVATPSFICVAASLHFSHRSENTAFEENIRDGPFRYVAPRRPIRELLLPMERDY